MTEGRTHLDCSRAIAALDEFGQAEQLAASPEEKQLVADQQDVAEKEKQRQEDVKNLHAQTLDQLVRVGPQSAI